MAQISLGMQSINFEKYGDFVATSTYYNYNYNYNYNITIILQIFITPHYTRLKAIFLYFNDKDPRSLKLIVSH